jgi:hypothetical protein
MLQLDLERAASSGPQWAQTFPAYKHGYRWVGPFVGVTVAGNISILFNFTASVTVAGSMLSSAGGVDIGLVTLSAMGDATGSRAFGDDQDQFVLNARGATDGTLLFMGSFLGTIVPDPAHAETVLKSTAIGGSLFNEIPGDGFVVALNQLTNGVRLAKAFGTAGHATDAMLDPDGGVVLTGTFTGVANLNGTPLDGGQGSAVLLAKFKPDGSLLWDRAFTHTQDPPLSPYLAVSPDGSSWLGGASNIWPLDFGTGALNTSTLPLVGFFARFAP